MVGQDKGSRYEYCQKQTIRGTQEKFALRRTVKPLPAVVSENADSAPASGESSRQGRRVNRQRIRERPREREGQEHSEKKRPYQDVLDSSK